MKKVIAICLLVATLLAGSISLDAKTTKKKGKTRTTQTASAQWNGDIPSAKIIEQFFMGGLSEAQKSKYKDQFINHGYHFEDYDEIAIKEDVCEIETQRSAQTIDLFIKIYDSAQRQWLYKDLQNFVKSQGKRTGFFVFMEGNHITFSLGRFS